MEDTYEPFGDDWKKEVMGLPKVELVKLYAAACLKSQSLEQQLEALLLWDLSKSLEAGLCAIAFPEATEGKKGKKGLAVKGGAR